MEQNISENLCYALDYLQKVIDQRLAHYFAKETPAASFSIPALSFPKDDGSSFTRFVRQSGMKTEELIVLLLALVPHVAPSFLDSLIGKYLPNGGNFPSFGGVKGKNHRGMLPTGETALFVLAGEDISARMNVEAILSSTHFFANERILSLEELPTGEPRMSGKLVLDSDYLNWLTSGYMYLPKMSMMFPAQHLTTKMTWDDLVLNRSTLAQVKELQDWIEYNDVLFYDWGMEKKLKLGYRVLFHGPPGTGKTLTATLLGNETGKPVFRIDLSMVISKYIGETEKNLSNLFDKAQNKNWILFFDEADALFGKRTSVKDAHDRYANQEVAYLLQRIEDYPGLTILASNFKSNIDDAFLRRFNAIIYFPMPQYEERLTLWQKAFPEQVHFAQDVNFEQLAKQYPLSGSHIMNIVHYVCLQSLVKKTTLVTQASVVQGIQREIAKEGKMG